ncbi:uncharacterized protein N7482_004103 [Penicillium canariense]|uniref:Uncharacterized protein n=1 Tax=Penicillium canariense TaxID=189055 RepID=A0A9W9I5T5_9EURO|nr:uncharacterized protein N7482_004103 [Penicillium canariense]KAJ5168509.1 hypothetical protein N7482_004103 [Penicillium canariense]
MPFFAFATEDHSHLLEARRNTGTHQRLPALWQRRNSPIPGAGFSVAKRKGTGSDPPWATDGPLGYEGTGLDESHVGGASVVPRRHRGWVSTREACSNERARGGSGSQQ